ncbi:flagellar protein FlgN [Paraclostridium sordellii]|uniref:Flagellar biosynthesis protein n=1 Tax=Paraclostridium sordellii TaxID=1505 RepID=A0A0C7QUX0_PARSO|nr:flagellar protein FlgN [Paeniclostridium sordellii]QYE97297.1 flagellar protein FlgN [Paeniclostridium sordellii]CEN21696.1 flagellar biosynthesis protein [[Clostridium] sordellii] [Paeniclostridium sordellii]CEN79313.1 flagellar biosynthesis protein [[Clostridium] sordellii] [Paeniclostridium sordellii]CEP81879.1 flagellar biosynthesis protein [[Clostridium] sordellii] [Paeniclostridium sordellii]CEP88158.1 flagellar biosynthesis protein [[Clostridium] sordellii] [Paeniclostridium sordelli
MNPELKVIIYEERKLFNKLLDLLDEQHDYIVNKEVTKMDKIAKDLENLAREIAKIEIQRREITSSDVSMSSLIENCEDEKIKEAYNEITSNIKMIELQKETNQTLLKQRLFFTKKMMNVIKPNQGIGTYNAHGQVGK